LTTSVRGRPPVFPAREPHEKARSGKGHAKAQGEGEGEEVIASTSSNEEATYQLQSKVIVYDDLDFLLGAQVPLRGLDGGMAEQTA
jgi:hypothetical protein